MVDVISSVSWDRVWDQIKALWPRWKNNIEQEDLWRRKLEVYEEHRLISAIEDVLAEHPVQTPRLAWIISKLRGSQSDAPNRRAQITGFPCTPREADEAEEEIIMLLRALPPTPADLTEGAKRFLYWKSGDWPKPAQVQVVVDAAVEKPYEIWPAGLAGMVWAAGAAAQQQERQPPCDVTVQYEPGAIEVDGPALLQQGGG